MRAALKMVEQRDPKNVSYLDITRSVFGEVLLANGQSTAARRLLEGVLARQERSEIGRPGDLPMTRGRLAEVLLAQGLHRKALILIGLAAAEARAFMDSHDPRLAWLLVLDCQAQLANQQPQAALASFAEAWQIIDGSGLSVYYRSLLTRSCTAFRRAGFLERVAGACQ